MATVRVDWMELDERGGLRGFNDWARTRAEALELARYLLERRRVDPAHVEVDGQRLVANPK